MASYWRDREYHGVKTYDRFNARGRKLKTKMWRLKEFLKYGLKRGFQNLWRWTPVIWYDTDWDWTSIARVLEYKLRKHAEYEKNYGHHINSEKDARDMLICAILLRRLQDDKYYENAKKFFKGPPAAHAAARHAREDQRYLGLLLGKYLTSWWD